MRIKDSDAYKSELKNDYIVTKELSALYDGLGLRCGRLLAFANAFVITAKHVDFSAEKPHRSSRDAHCYPLACLDEVPTAKQSPVTGE